MLGTVTGKPVNLGRIAGDGPQPPPAGVVYSALNAMASIGLNPSQATAVVQGFGKVGRGTARFLHEAGVKVLAVADVYSTIRNDKGIDIPALEASWMRPVPSTDSPARTRCLRASCSPSACDVVVPAAIEGVIAEQTAR